MAIATALCRLNDLGHSGLPLFFFPETDFIYKDLHIVQEWTKTERGKLKKIQDFCLGTSNPAILRLHSARNYGR